MLAEHEQQPTLFPFGLAIGIAVGLFGLIVDPTVVGALGGAIAIVFGLLWARGATGDMRTSSCSAPSRCRKSSAPVRRRGFTSTRKPAQGSTSMARSSGSIRSNSTPLSVFRSRRHA